MHAQRTLLRMRAEVGLHNVVHELSAPFFDAYLRTGINGSPPYRLSAMSVQLFVKYTEKSLRKPGFMMDKYG
jgi:hypothetical protein